MLEFDVEDIMKDIRKSRRDTKSADVWAEELKSRVKSYKDICIVWGLQQFQFDPDAQEIARFVRMDMNYQFHYESDGDKGEYAVIERV